MILEALLIINIQSKLFRINFESGANVLECFSALMLSIEKKALHNINAYS